MAHMSRSFRLWKRVNFFGNTKFCLRCKTAEQKCGYWYYPSTVPAEIWPPALIHIFFTFYTCHLRSFALARTSLLPPPLFLYQLEKGNVSTLTLHQRQIVWKGREGLALRRGLSFVLKLKFVPQMLLWRVLRFFWRLLSSAFSAPDARGTPTKNHDRFLPTTFHCSADTGRRKKNPHFYFVRDGAILSGTNFRFFRQDFYPLGVYMVKSCPTSWSEAQVNKLCLRQVSNTSWTNPL